MSVCRVGRRSWKARSRRRRSIALRRAAVVIQAPGLAGLAVARPGGQRDGERVLERVLGQLEVAAQMADQRGEDASGLLAKGALDGAAHIAGTCISGRTSTWP